MHHSFARIARFAALIMALGLGAAACGDDSPESADDATTTTADAGTTSSSSVATSASVSTSSTVADTTTTVTAAPTTVEVDDGFPGEPLDFGPAPGTGLAVVGVRFDDVLNFRDGPSPSADIVTSFGPLHPDLDMAAVGEAWAAPTGVWWRVNVAGDEAWANQAFLGSLGSTVDAFDEIAAELAILKFETVEAAALAVAELRASTDPVSRVVFVGEPLAFDDMGFALVDVLDLGDDSVKGERIRIDVAIAFDEESGEEGAQDVAFVVLTDVQITPICGRGTSGGLCI